MSKRSSRHRRKGVIPCKNLSNSSSTVSLPMRGTQVPLWKPCIACETNARTNRPISVSIRRTILNCTLNGGVCFRAGKEKRRCELKSLKEIDASACICTECLHEVGKLVAKTRLMFKSVVRSDSEEEGEIRGEDDSEAEIPNIDRSRRRIRPRHIEQRAATFLRKANIGGGIAKKSGFSKDVIDRKSKRRVRKARELEIDSGGIFTRGRGRKARDSDSELRVGLTQDFIDFAREQWKVSKAAVQARKDANKYKGITW